MPIPIYNSFEEKDENFRLVKVDTIEEFMSYFGENLDNPKGVFRGIGNSKYKIFTSLQRERLTGKLAGNFSIEEYIANFKKNRLLTTYFNAIGVNQSKISILSLLQHYGAPTPLIDFTKNLKTAIYFATEDYTGIHVTDTANELNNYFSVFHISEDNSALLNVKRPIQDIQHVDDKLRKIFFDPERYQTQGVAYIDNLTTYSLEDIYMVDLNNDFNVFSVQNNIRILAQEGLFIHNGFETEPLEVALKIFFIPATEFIGSELDDIANDEKIEESNAEYLHNLEKNKLIQKQLEENIVVSYEINKSIIPEINKIIKIGKDEIYPQLGDICSKIYAESNK